MTEHFTFEEMTRTDTGLDNTPMNECVEKNLDQLADALEEVRGILGGRPIHIDSAYRSPEVNARVHGAKNSAHMKGLAADFVCPEFGTPEDICYAIIDSRLRMDQLILEATWVHLAIGGQERGQVLTCIAPGKYVPGLHAGDMA